MKFWVFLVFTLAGCSENLISKIGELNSMANDYDEVVRDELTPEPNEMCDAVTIETEDQQRPVDVLWAIDTSPSMAGEKKMVRDNLNSFAQQMSDAGLDAHVVLIASSSNDGGICVQSPLGTGSCPNDHNPPQLYRDYQWVGSHNALPRFISQWSNYESVIRDNSMKYYAVVTDDDAEWSASHFTSQRNSQDPAGADNWTFFGLFCKYRDSGNVYSTLVTQTNGLHVELCTSSPDWQGVFDEMFQTVMENRSLDCTIDIPDAPTAFPFESNKLNVDYIPGDGSSASRFYRVDSSADCDSRGGWYYDDNSNPSSIELCDASCDAVDGDFEGTLDIWFGCTTQTHP